MYNIFRILAASRSLQKLHFSSDNAWRDLLNEGRIKPVARDIRSSQSSLQQVALEDFDRRAVLSLQLWSSFTQLRRIEIKAGRYAQYIPWSEVEEIIDQNLNLPNLHIQWEQHMACRTYSLNSDGVRSNR
ncbi:predicted protein [Lichtheimia corymbifera JMRC:FSU:9682]|uniref:Uncharacterized protein n=1 Tax=Lichtheimia corymbifera JMRC:FSU:9682 TaxID=1263082 RepID=A0A068SCI8_9FUNG|nr:predicted protein [Lichtheimia corymbifera JMRC:FSU:9682]